MTVTRFNRSLTMTQRVSEMLIAHIVAAALLLFPTTSMSRFMTSAVEFDDSTDVAFTWSEAQSRSVQIYLEYRDPAGAWQRVILGSGFLLSPDGLFVTAYHVMTYCLKGLEQNSVLATKVDCSTSQVGVRYVAVNERGEFPIEIISHLKEMESTRGKETHTPDEILTQKDFVIGKLKSNKTTFLYWRLRDFEDGTVDADDARAELQLTPMLPPKQVFIAGFPQVEQFAISQGFLNLTEKHKRGYFAVDMNVYTESYLQSQDVALDTDWGMRTQNHMSGGAVVDAAGYVIGLLVNGNDSTAAVLSIENILATFFIRAAIEGAHPVLLLFPTDTPLFLKQAPVPDKQNDNPPAV